MGTVPSGFLPERLLLAVTRDKYEHPVYVAYNCVEMAREMGLKTGTVRSYITTGTGKYRYFWIDIDKDLRRFE